jgi:cysteine-rich repeat protein
VAKHNKNYSFALIAIVAIVAIVALIFLFMNLGARVALKPTANNELFVEQQNKLGEVVKKPLVSAVCTDTDGGQNYYVSGYVIYKGINYPDICSDSQLSERYCYINSNGKLVIGTEAYHCLEGCQDSACIDNSYCGNSIPEISEQCEDGNSINGDGCDANCILEIP